MQNFASPRPDKNARNPARRRGINYKIKLALALAIIAVGLAGRSALDKVLALRGGSELVALWAQVFSVVEMVSGVALAGVGAGLSVLAAQTSASERQQLFLRRALRLGFAVSVPLALVAALAGSLAGAAWLTALAALAGAVAVVPGMVNSLWLGQQHRGRMLALAAASGALPLAAALIAPNDWLLEAITLSCAVPAVVIFLVPHGAHAPQRADERALHSYILPGVVIGILSPASLLVARGVVGDAVSWHDGGVLQALWRISDWVTGVAAGVFSVLYLPRLAAAYPTPGIRRILVEAARAVLIPSAGAFVLLAVFCAPLLEILYDETFRPSALAVALLFAGSLMRVISWLPLFGLYAALRTRAIAVGELVSLPLFAVLVFAAREHLTLEIVAALWLATYIAYAAFNFWALRKVT